MFIVSQCDLCRISEVFCFCFVLFFVFVFCCFFVWLFLFVCFVFCFGLFTFLIDILFYFSDYIFTFFFGHSTGIFKLMTFYCRWYSDTRHHQWWYWTGLHMKWTSIENDTTTSSWRNFTITELKSYTAKTIIFFYVLFLINNGQMVKHRSVWQLNAHDRHWS